MSSALGWCLFGLPVGRGDKRLKAHPADDLFERRVVAIWRDKERAHCDLGRILEVLAGQPAQAQSRACRGLKQQRSSVCLLLALAPQFDRILGFDLDRAERLALSRQLYRARIGLVRAVRIKSITCRRVACSSGSAKSAPS